MRHATTGTPVAPDASIVEPAPVHNLVSPPVSFFEPPPVYSESDVPHCYHSRCDNYPNGRFELPPPYSPMDERDTAGLILNEGASGAANGQRALPRYEQLDDQVPVHSLQCQRAPTPPIRGSSYGENNSNRYNLRRRQNSQEGDSRPNSVASSNVTPSNGQQRILKENDINDIVLQQSDSSCNLGVRDHDTPTGAQNLNEQLDKLDQASDCDTSVAASHAGLPALANAIDFASSEA